MKLTMIYLPVKDLEAALTQYRDVLGFEVAWREGELTAGLAVPGSDVLLMLDQASPEGEKPGPFFEVDDVDAFYAEHQGALAFVAPPSPIPPGRYAAFDDPSGNRVHLLDLSAER